jgi:hypothetical protein
MRRTMSTPRPAARGRRTVLRRTLGALVGLVVGFGGAIAVAGPAGAVDESFMVQNRHTRRCLEANPLQFVVLPIVGRCYPANWRLHRWSDNTWEFHYNGYAVCLEDTFANGLEINPCNMSRGQSWYFAANQGAPSELTTLRNQHTGRYLEDSMTSGLRTRTLINSNTLRWSVT